MFRRVKVYAAWRPHRSRADSIQSEVFIKLPRHCKDRTSESLKTRMNLLVYTCQDELRRIMQEFIEYYNHRRHHDTIGNGAR